MNFFLREYLQVQKHLRKVLFSPSGLILEENSHYFQSKIQSMSFPEFCASFWNPLFTVTGHCQGAACCGDRWCFVAADVEWCCAISKASQRCGQLQWVQSQRFHALRRHVYSNFPQGLGDTDFWNGLTFASMDITRTLGKGWWKLSLRKNLSHILPDENGSCKEAVSKGK